jgi:hypothetical protein
MNKSTNVGLCEVLQKRDLWPKNKWEGGGARNVTA